MSQYLVFFWGGGMDLSKQALQYCVDGRNVIMKKKNHWKSQRRLYLAVNKRKKSFH